MAARRSRLVSATILRMFSDPCRESASITPAVSSGADALLRSDDPQEPELISGSICATESVARSALQIAAAVQHVSQAPQTPLEANLCSSSREALRASQTA